MARAAMGKTSRPVLYEPVARVRLFKLLDELRERPLVWVTGPPGSGKTTLVATWLQARSARAIWYQLDATDQDPATFLHYLRLAARRSQGKRPTLPPPNPDSSRDIAPFARRYLRALLSSLGKDAILVLDNLHEASSSSVLFGALAGAVEETTQGAQLIVISRDRPDRTFARLEASRALSLVTAEQLQFTLEETQSLIRARGGLDASTTETLHALCRGWAAGLSLLIERWRRGELARKVSASDSLLDVFESFADESFKRVAQTDQLILLRLAELPRFTIELAVRASGDERAARVIESLYRRNLFVDLLESESGGAEACYEFHSLFRAFLRKIALEVFTPAELAATRRTLAHLLLERDATEDAFALVAAADDWKGVTAIIYKHSEALLRQGRSQLLHSWIAKLPEPLVAQDAWLLHWSGAAQVGRSPGAARDILERAYALATTNADVMCRVQSAAGIIETIILEYADFARLDPWIETLEGLLPALAFADADSHLRIYAALIGAILQRQGNPPAMQAHVEQTFALIDRASNANLKVAALTHLLRYGVLCGRMSFAKRALALAQPVLTDPDVTSLRKGICENFVGWYYVNVPHEGHARETIERIERRGKEDNLPELRRFAAISGYWVEMSHLRSTPAASRVHALEEVMNPANAYDAGCLAGLKAWSAMVSGDGTAGLRHAQEAVASFDQAGSCWHRIFGRAVLGWVYAETKDFRNARRWVEEARSLAEQTNLHVLDAQFDQIDALIADARGEPLQELIEKFLNGASAYGTGLPLRFFPTVAPRLCALALRMNIEPVYARALIRTWRWRSEDPTDEKWPWPIRLYTLGGFELHVRDERVSFSGHAPRKVLSLLKAIVCLGVNNIRDRRLINAVWSGEESDAGKAAFNVTLHRLRKLLQHPDAIAIEDGVVTLNTDVCWIDAIAFERLLGSARSPDRVERALALYRGNLLPEDEGEPWSGYLREKLRRKFLHEVGAIGTALESSEQWQAAIELYQRGLDADNLVEAFYQGLMRCYRALDRGCEAISAYQRMRQLFSITLGIEPTAESEWLYRTLLADRMESTGAPLAGWRKIAR